jgi:glucose/arabinose dehydrogenase
MKKYIIVIAVIAAAVIAWTILNGVQNAAPFNATGQPAATINTQQSQAASTPSATQPSQMIEQLQTDATNSTGLPLTPPPGFSISVFAKDLGNPRVIVQDPSGNLIVSLMAGGKVVALPDKNGDSKSDGTKILADNLTRPHGLAFRCPNPANWQQCELYVAESDKISVYNYDATNLTTTFKKKIIDLPSNGNHFSKTIMFLNEPANNRMLVAMGSDCNVCNEDDARRAAISVLNVDTGELTPYAKGLRNSVFMTTDPVFGKIYATEMGRDNLGDNLPPDEINIIEANKNYGWPICYGQNIHDADFDKNTYIRNPCAAPFVTPALIDIPAHSAPLGLAFIPEEGWPQDYWYNIIVAYHGSWNRSVKTGYKIIRIPAKVVNGQLEFGAPEDFITGWLQPDGKVLGRPAGILTQPGGTMYIADDTNGMIYKVKSLSQP